MRVRATRLLSVVLATAVGVTTLGVGAAPASAAPATEDWRGWLNQVRAEAGLSGVSANSSWSTGARNHAVYAVRNQKFSHDENTKLPHHTASGRHATRTGNLYGSTVRMTPKATIDGWMESPGHAMWMLHPHATAAGYGEFHDPKQPAGGYAFNLRWVAVLPIVDSVNWSKAPVAFTYPKPGATLARQPQHLYATFSSKVTGSASATVKVNGRTVGASAKVVPGSSYPHNHTVAVKLNERLPVGAAVEVTVKPGNQAARAWSFGAAAKVHSQFRDVRQDAFFHNPVDWAWKRSIASGTTDTTFTPYGSVTRAQAVTFLWRSAGHPRSARTSASFRDVTANSYFATAAAWAEEQGITQGTTASTFSPHQPVTRSQMVTFLWRANGSPKVSGGAGFADVPANAFFAQPVAWAKQRNITGGTTPGRFSPGDVVTRGQAVTFLYRAS